MAPQEVTFKLKVVDFLIQCCFNWSSEHSVLLLILATGKCHTKSICVTRARAMLYMAKGQMLLKGHYNGQARIHRVW